MNILITGGAGYIGSHVAKQLLENTGYSISILDNLSTGSEKTLQTLEQIRGFSFFEIDLKEESKVADILKTNKIDTILHFAASIVVPESVQDPLKYYLNNTINTTQLIKNALSNNVKRFVFSSTAAVYGEPTNANSQGIHEGTPTTPINPYGRSKLMSEMVLQDAARICPDFKYIIFRYFNVAGADMYYENGILSPRIGQSFPNATHLIQVASECASGKRKQMQIYGDDYPTKDGTAVRDYIHIEDLADAHIRAISYLQKKESDIFNIGYSKGYSVKEVIETMRTASLQDIVAHLSARRQGDPAMLVSDSARLREQMKWEPKYDDLGLICESAYLWERTL